MDRLGLTFVWLDPSEREFADRILEADIAFLAIAGQWAEDGKLQGLLDSVGVPYTGSGVLASATAMHKPTAKTLVAAAGVRVLPHALIRERDDLADVARAAETLGMPVILKPCSEGGSIGVQVIRDPGRLPKVLAENARRGEWLIESFTAGSAVTCGVLQRDGALMTLPPLETVPTTAEFYDYAGPVQARQPGHDGQRCRDQLRRADHDHTGECPPAGVPAMTAVLPLTAADVRQAQRRLHGVAAATPALSSPALDSLLGHSVVCKAEALQRTGSFKFRGAYNALAALSQARSQHGVVGASSGNHAQALALAGRLLDVPVTVVVPRDAPDAKVNGARSLGARIVRYDRHTDDRDAITSALAAEHGYTIVPSADDRSVMAGAGTATLELLRQAPGLTMILVPVGGGGLAAGTAVAAKAINRHITVIGVEPRTGADTAASVRAGHRVTLPAVPDTIADGLRHTSPARLPWEVNKVLLDDVVTVADDDIAQAMRWAFDHLKIVAEPSGAVALAALAGGGLPPGPAGVIVSGGSVDYRTFRAVAGRLSDALDPTVA